MLVKACDDICIHVDVQRLATDVRAMFRFSRKDVSTDESEADRYFVCGGVGASILQCRWKHMPACYPSTQPWQGFW